MNKEEFKQIRKKAGLTHTELAAYLKDNTGFGSVSLVEGLESGRKKIQKYQSNCMKQLKGEIK